MDSLTFHSATFLAVAKGADLNSKDNKREDTGTSGTPDTPRSPADSGDPAGTGKPSRSGDPGGSSKPARSVDPKPAGRLDRASRSGDPKDSKASGSGDRPSPGVRLTERQRQEARRLRQAQRRKPVRGNPLSAGIRAVGHEVKRTAIFVGRSTMAGLDYLRPVGGAILAGIIWLLAALRRLSIATVAVIGSGVGILGRLLVAADRVLSPRRGLITVTLIAAGLLIVSQFLDFRATEIGQPGYTGIEDVTTAPRVDSDTPIGAHSFLLLAAAVVALAAGLGTALTGRRRFGTLVALAGGATLLVSLTIDLPRGLDVADAKLNYAGVRALLLSGFWLQVAAGITLLFSGLLLLASPANRPVPRPARTDSSSDASPVGSPSPATPADSSSGPSRTEPAIGREPRPGSTSALRPVNESSS